MSFPEMASEDTNQNLIGRILGPRGISVRQLEDKFDCKVLIRGKGSIKVGSLTFSSFNFSISNF